MIFLTASLFGETLMESFMMDRAGCHDLKPRMNVGITPSGTARDQAPPDVMQWTTWKVFLPKTLVLNVVKPLDVTPSL